MSVLDHFDGYRGLGFKVIPLHPFSKVPVFRNWQKSYDAQRCRDHIVLHQPQANLGLVLGEFLDAEADTPEADAMLSSLIGDYPHPRFQSSRSTHHLFINPEPRLTIAKVQGIEFRGNRHQSVLPPSVHEDGTKYQWLRPFVWPIPVMPKSLLEVFRAAEFHRARKRKHRQVVKPGHCRPWCGCCQKKVFINRGRYMLEIEAFKHFNYNWMCNDCREMNVRPMCREIRNRLKQVAHGVTPV